MEREVVERGFVGREALDGDCKRKALWRGAWRSVAVAMPLENISKYHVSTTMGGRGGAAAAIHS